QVRRCLSRVGQLPTGSLHNALSPSLKALIADKLIKHSDGDVKVALAYCLIYLTRITAPDAPYNEHQMEEVLTLIVSSFENLHDKSSPWYKVRISILKIFAEVKLCLEMLNLECDALILEMFQNFLKTIREHHPENVFSSMKTIMVLVLEESDDISLDLLSPILDCLKKENEVVLPIARKLGESVLESCATKVKPYLRKAVKKLGISLDDYSDALASVCTVLLEASESETVRSSEKRSSSSKGSGSSKKKTHPSSGSKIKGASESSFGSDSPNIKKRKVRKVGLTAAKGISAKQLPIISEEIGEVPLIKRTRTSETTASKVPPSSSTRAASEVSAAVATEAPQTEGNSETLPNVIIAEIAQSQPSTPPAQTILTQSPPSSQRITNDKPELLRDVIYTLSVLSSDKPQPPPKVTPSTSETSLQPYKFIHPLVLNPLVSKPNLELLRDVIYNDVRRVYQMRDEFVMPQELIQEADALKEKFCAAIDELKELSLKELGESLTELTDRMVRAIEHADVKMLTNYHHWPQNGIQEHAEEFMEEEIVAEEIISEEIVHTSPEKAVSESCKEKEVMDRAQEFPKESMPSEPMIGTEVLKLQEDLASQKVKQETLEAQITSLAENQNEMKEDQKELKAEVSSISVKQETMEEKMDSMISKLDAILLLLQQQRPHNP
ncbi:sister chromatid cohesion PDS5-like protein, partial [Trifolium pratense]